MNFIQEITEKYNGEYIEFDKREFHTPAGKYVTQLQKGIIKIDRIKFSISHNKSIGVNFNHGGVNDIINDQIHIFLHLKTNEKKLNIVAEGTIDLSSTKKSFVDVLNIYTDGTVDINFKTLQSDVTNLNLSGVGEVILNSTSEPKINSNDMYEVVNLHKKQ